jgi:hypothetical protein
LSKLTGSMVSKKSTRVSALDTRFILKLVYTGLEITEST